jgi:hypothetical protein
VQATGGRLQLRKWTLTVEHFINFEVDLYRGVRPAKTYRVTGRKLGAPGATAGELEPASGQYSFAVQARSEDVRVVVRIPGPFSAHFLSAAYEGYYTFRSTRV